MFQVCKTLKWRTYLLTHNYEVNGTHLSADSSSFLERRRHGLVRFTNALVRHPVLGQEQLVVMFLTVPTASPDSSNICQLLNVSTGAFGMA